MLFQVLSCLNKNVLSLKYDCRLFSTAAGATPGVHPHHKVSLYLLRPRRLGATMGVNSTTQFDPFEATVESIDGTFAQRAHTMGQVFIMSFFERLIGMADLTNSVEIQRLLHRCDHTCVNTAWDDELDETLLTAVHDQLRLIRAVLYCYELESTEYLDDFMTCYAAARGHV